MFTMLTDDQCRFFDDHGYLVIDNVFDPVEIKTEYAALLDDLYSQWQADELVPPAQGWEPKLLAAYRAGCDWFQSMDCSLPGGEISADTPMYFGPAIFNLITGKRMLDLVEALIGPEITSNPIQHIRIKPPATNLTNTEIRPHITATDWHQDRAVALEEADETKMITVWCAVTDATPENGCLQVIPRGGSRGMLPHCPRTQTGIADGFINENEAQPLPVQAGGVVVFHPLTPHASLINRTDRFRWSFDIRYNRTGEPTGRSHFPEFVVRSKKQQEAVVTDWMEMRRAWEDARSRLANQPHIPIHRWKRSIRYSCHRAEPLRSRCHGRRGQNGQHDPARTQGFDP